MGALSGFLKGREGAVGAQELSKAKLVDPPLSSVPT